MSSKDKLYEIWGQLTFGNHSIQISTEATGSYIFPCKVNTFEKVLRFQTGFPIFRVIIGKVIRRENSKQIHAGNSISSIIFDRE